MIRTAKFISVAEILVILISCFSSVACSPQPNLASDHPKPVSENMSAVRDENITVNDTSINSPLKSFGINLYLPYAPLLNQEVDLTCKLYSITDCPMVKVWLYLPAGGVELGDNKTYIGNIRAGQELDVIKRIIFQKPGPYFIEGRADFIYSENFTGRTIGYAVLTVGVDKSSLAAEPYSSDTVPPPKLDTVPSGVPLERLENRK
jgi:hypothetical protein